MVNDTSGCITVIFGASIIIINVDKSVQTSIARVAGVSGARISVITDHRSRNTSLDCVTSVFGTFVCVSAINRSVYALTGVAIARIECTSIVVIAVNCSIEAFSRIGIASNGLAWLLLANDWSVNTVSVGAGVSCACIVIVTNFISVLTSFYGVAGANRALVSIVTYNWKMLDSICNSTRISCACIMVIKIRSTQRSVNTTR
jgi:hypothetical protein